MTETCWCGSDAYRDDDGDLQCSATPLHDPTYRMNNTEPTHLYLSGPMTGYPQSNYPAFNEAAAELRAAGFTVWNPAENGDLGSQYSDLLRMDMEAILGVEGVATLEGWWSSKGAMVEVHMAGVLTLPIRSVAEWIQRRNSLDAAGTTNE